MKKIFSLIVAMFIVISLVGCTKPISSNTYIVYDRDLGEAFTTVSWIRIIAQKNRKDEVNNVTQELINILSELDNKFNVIPRGDGKVTKLMEVNNNAGINPVVVDDEIIYVLKEAIRVAKISEVDGLALFDPTIAPVWDKWDFVNKYYDFLNPYQEDIPAQDDIIPLLGLVDYKKIIIDEENKTVFLSKEGMKLDLGGILKGYAADKIEQHLVDKGFDSAIIDIGGNIQFLGKFKSDDDTKPWMSSFKTPYVTQYDENYDLMYKIGHILVEDKTVVTSGVYEKYILGKDNKKYHHILDPRTGFPFDNGVIAVSVITDVSITADAFSTTLFAMGLETGLDYVNRTEGLECVYVVDNGEGYDIYISNGLENSFIFNENVEELGYTFKGKR